MLLCVLFFFFFKQKTAYEMRISDWSSDVCSSDLHGWSDRLHHCSDCCRLVSLQADGQMVCDTGAKAQTARLYPHPCLWSRNLFHSLKIGRASCRERVCQYV